MDLKDKYKDMSLEDLTEAIKQFYEAKLIPQIKKEDVEEIVKEIRLPSIEHHEWYEDNVRYSAWKIDTGDNIVWTGDGGKAMFDEAIKKQGYGNK